MYKIMIDGKEVERGLRLKNAKEEVEKLQQKFRVSNDRIEIIKE